MSLFSALYDVGARFGKIVMRRAWPLHCNENISPFFIVGAGRSGTTLLRRMLVASEQVHIPPETYVLSQVIEHYRRNTYLEWPTLVNQCMAMFELHPEFETFHITLRPLLPKLYALPENERSLAKMLDMFYCFHAEQTGISCSRWGDKTPMNTFVMDDIYAVFPRAKFIHLLRDGVDVVQSCMKRGLIPKLSDAASRWKEAFYAVEDFTMRHPAACRELRYEQLVSEVEVSMQTLCDWLDIAYQSKMLTAGDVKALGDMDYTHYESSLKAVSEQYIGTGRRDLNDQQKQQLQAMIGQELLRLGYPKAYGDK
ncbi:MAG: sulfotransferase [Mariprofundaceae bacterium]|nr:sulfotransferase [Mariprofundaceae bacterium]